MCVFRVNKCRSSCKICVDIDTFSTKGLTQRIQSDCEESVNIDTYFTTQFTFVDAKNTHHSMSFLPLNLILEPLKI